MTEKDDSYIDYQAFLSPSFSPYVFANSIILATNNPTDVPLDLSTPLSKVLFDTQEVNATIDELASEFALPLLTYTQQQNASSARISQPIVSQVSSLSDDYKRLEKEVVQRYESAEEIRQVCERLWETAKLGRSVVRCLQWGKQLEIQLAEISETEKNATRREPKEYHVALVRCSENLLNLHNLLSSNEKGDEGYGLERVEVIKTLQSSIINPAAGLVLSKSQQIVREFFTISQPSTVFTHLSDIRAKIISALTSLYTLSLTSPRAKDQENWEPEYLVNTLQECLRIALNSSLTSLYRALITLPTLDRTLLEVSARCQKIVLLESILSEIIPPSDPNLILDIVQPPNFLHSLLSHLETSSLPSWFWRSLASGLNTKMTDLVTKGGASVRALKNNRASVKEAIRECILKGNHISGKADIAMESKLEREIAVLIGSIFSPLGKGS